MKPATTRGGADFHDLRLIIKYCYFLCIVACSHTIKIFLVAICNRKNNIPAC